MRRQDLIGTNPAGKSSGPDGCDWPIGHYLGCDQ